MDETSIKELCAFVLTWFLPLRHYTIWSQVSTSFVHLSSSFCNVWYMFTDFQIKIIHWTISRTFVHTLYTDYFSFYKTFCFSVIDSKKHSSEQTHTNTARQQLVWVSNFPFMVPRRYVRKGPFLQLFRLVQSNVRPILFWIMFNFTFIILFRPVFPEGRSNYSRSSWYCVQEASQPSNSGAKIFLRRISN
jgi:hypothetical protein